MEEQRKMKPLQKKDFGKTSKGELATVYTLENEAGMQISVSDFGATLTSVLVPDKDDNLVEVTLGYDDVTGYEAGLGNAFGASVGRNANRIGGAVIEINGTEYHLTRMTERTTCTADLISITEECGRLRTQMIPM